MGFYEAPPNEYWFYIFYKKVFFIYNTPCYGRVIAQTQ